MSFGTIFALGTLALAASCGWDAVKLLLFRRPAVGHVVASSYTEQARQAARDAHPFDWLYKVTAGNAKPVVGDNLMIEYDVEGERYRQPVHTAHLRGDRADRYPTVWYDPSDPGRMTIDGPGGALAAMVGLLVLAAWSAGLVM